MSSIITYEQVRAALDALHIGRTPGAAKRYAWSLLARTVTARPTSSIWPQRISAPSLPRPEVISRWSIRRRKYSTRRPSHSTAHASRIGP